MAVPAPHASPKWLLDKMLADPLTDVRYRYEQALNAEAFDVQTLDDLIQALQQAIPPAERANLDKQIIIIREALHDPFKLAFRNISLKTESERLLWAFAATYVAANGQSCGPVERHSIWSKIKGDVWAVHELGINYAHLFKSTQDSKARVQWGLPGSGFHYRPAENLINLDIVACLVEPQYLYNFYHEESHRLFSLKFPPSMERENQRLKQLAEKHATALLNEQEKKEAMETGIRATLLSHFFNALEDQMADTYALRRFEHDGRPDPIDRMMQLVPYGSSFAKHIHHYDDAIRLNGTPPAPKANPTAADKWDNLQLAATACMYMRPEHGLLPDTLESWRRLGIEPEWLEAKGEAPGDPPVKGMDAIQLLMQYSRRIGDEQPPVRLYDRPNDMQKEAPLFCDRRLTIIEETFDRFGKPLLKDTVQEKLNNLEQQEKEQGRSETGLSSPIKIIFLPPGSPMPQGEPGPQIQNQNGQLVIVIILPPDSPQEARKQKQPPPIAGKPDHGKDDPDSQNIPPGQVVPEKLPTLEELRQQQAEAEQLEQVQKVLQTAMAEQAAQQVAKDAGKPQPKPNLPERKPHRPKHGPGARLGPGDNARAFQAIGQKNLGEHELFLNQNSWAIDQLYEKLKDIQGSQQQLITGIEGYDITPHGLPSDPHRHVDLAIAKEAGGETLAHHELFPQPRDKTRPPIMNVAVLCDGSSSVVKYRDQILGVGTAMNAASKRCNEETPHPWINCFVNLWGAEQAVEVVAPDFSEFTIDAGIEGARQRANFFSSNLTPSIREFLKSSIRTFEGARRGDTKQQDLVGTSHLFIVSDGDIDDPDEAKRAIKTLLEICPKISVDVVIIDDPLRKRRAIGMDNMITTLKPEFDDRISITHVPGTKVAKGMVDAMDHALDRLKKEPPIGVDQALDQFRQAQNELGEGLQVERM